MKILKTDENSKNKRGAAGTPKMHVDSESEEKCGRSERRRPQSFLLKRRNGQNQTSAGDDADQFAGVIQNRNETDVFVHHEVDNIFR